MNQHVTATIRWPTLYNRFKLFPHALTKLYSVFIYFLSCFWSHSVKFNTSHENGIKRKVKVNGRIKLSRNNCYSYANIFCQIYVGWRDLLTALQALHPTHSAPKTSLQPPVPQSPALLWSSQGRLLVSNWTPVKKKRK